MNYFFTDLHCTALRDLGFRSKQQDGQGFQGDICETTSVLDL